MPFQISIHKEFMKLKSLFAFSEKKSKSRSKTHWVLKFLNKTENLPAGQSWSPPFSAPFCLLVHLD